jgi:hypothetical protein
MPCEAGLTGQPVRLSSASAMTDCDLLRIEKKAVMLALPSGTNIVRPVLYDTYWRGTSDIEGFGRPTFQFERKTISGSRLTHAF